LRRARPVDTDYLPSGSIKELQPSLSDERPAHDIDANRQREQFRQRVIPMCMKQLFGMTTPDSNPAPVGYGTSGHHQWGWQQHIAHFVQVEELGARRTVA
jgi:hypothetical protein